MLTLPGASCPSNCHSHGEPLLCAGHWGTGEDQAVRGPGPRHQVAAATIAVATVAVARVVVAQAEVALL